MSRVFAVLVALTALAAATAYAGSPWLVVGQVRDAAAAGDKDKLAALIDYARVREDLKRQVDSYPTKGARAAQNADFAPAQIVGRLGALRGDRKIDKLIAPGALVDLAGGKPGVEYLTIDTVRVTTRAPSRPPAYLVMERQGLIGWKVVKIVLPGETG